MKVLSVLVFVGLAGAFTAGAAERAADETAKAPLGIVLSAAKKRSPSVQSGARSQIACTVSGCHPIPPGCRPQTGYNWDGIPSGFDVVVCPLSRGRRG